MLGWEFPPFVTGGLGKACFGLAKSLGPYVDLTVILPKTNRERLGGEIKITGLDKLDFDALFDREAVPSETPEPVREAPHMPAREAEPSKASAVVEQPQNGHVAVVEPFEGNKAGRENPPGELPPTGPSLIKKTYIGYQDKTYETFSKVHYVEVALTPYPQFVNNERLEKTSHTQSEPFFGEYYEEVWPEGVSTERAGTDPYPMDLPDNQSGHPENLPEELPEEPTNGEQPSNKTAPEALPEPTPAEPPPPLKAWQYRELFSEDDIYGPRVLQKVAAYTDIVLKLADDTTFDVVHAHDWMTYQAALALKQLTGKPIVLHVHSLETDRSGSGVKNKVYDIEKKAFEAADLIMPVSQYTKQCIVDHYGISPDRIFPVHNGIDTLDLDSQAKKESPPPPQKAKKPIKTVLFLGRVTYQKGPGFLVETAARLFTKMSNARFLIAGIGDKLRETMHKAQLMGISDKIRFLGFLDENAVKEILAETDVYFMPSVSEPFGLSALEAVMQHIPVVVSKQAGVNEVLGKGLNADFWDTEKFANYIYAALNYKGLQRELTQITGQNIANITWEKAAADVYQCYRNLTGRA